MGSHIEIIARGLITVGPHVLLCRSVKAGYRYLPGGHVEFGEAAADALAREIREECGRESRIGDLVLVSEERFHDGKRERHELNLVFRAQLGAGTPGTVSGPAPAPAPPPTPPPNASGGVFHVEHPHDPAGRTRSEPAPAPSDGGRGGAGGATPPPPVGSLEPKIAFDWVRVGGGELAAAEVRPATIREWLMSLRLDDSGNLATPALSWRP